MKLLWHFNSHRQFEEYYLSSLFFNRSEFLKKHANVLVTCNNQKINIDLLKKQCVYDCEVEVVRTTNPINGVHTGQLVALNETFHKFKDYDFVIHTTPDVYLVEDKHLINLLNEEINSDNHMVFDYHKRYPRTYCTDFFLFKPQKIINFFGENFDPTQECHSIEAHVYKMVNSLKIPHRTICRGDSSLSWQVDDFGLIHNHNKDIIKNILINNTRPDKNTAFSHNFSK